MHNVGLHLPSGSVSVLSCDYYLSFLFSSLLFCNTIPRNSLIPQFIAAADIDSQGLVFHTNKEIPNPLSKLKTLYATVSPSYEVPKRPGSRLLLNAQRTMSRPVTVEEPSKADK